MTSDVLIDTREGGKRRPERTFSSDARKPILIF